MRSFTDGLGDRALAALRSNRFTLTSRVTGLYNGVDVGTFEITGGTYNSDETSSVRDRCTIEFVLPDVIDTAVFDPDVIDESGYRFRVEMGVYLSSTEIGYVTLGTFVVYDKESVESDRGRTVTLGGYDVTALVRDAKFETTYSISASTNYATAIAGVLMNGGFDPIVPTTPFTTPLLVFQEGDDRLAAARSMANSCGWEIVASPFGQPQVRPLLSPTVPVWEFVEGDECRMTKVGRKRTRTGVYNIAIVTGEPAGGTASVRGVAYDADNTSKTYVTDTYTGPFGRVPVREKSQYVTTNDQAFQAAQTLLLSKKGFGQALAIEAFTCPALETGDMVRVVRERLDIDELVPLKSTTIDLAPDRLMSVTTREVAA